MTGKPPPDRKEAAEAARRARLEREAAALRANLRRRKAQARAQSGKPPESPSGSPPTDSPPREGEG